MVNNLINFPTVNCITLETSKNRQNNILEESKKYNLNVDFYYGIDGKTNNIKELKQIEGLIDNNYVSIPGLACIISHLNSIRNWLLTTNEPYGFFCEDDIMLSTNEYWNFLWEDFIQILPSKWNIIQLTVVRENFGEDINLYTKLHPYVWDNWSACSYIISRGYAEGLIKQHYINENHYDLNLPYFPGTYPLPENVLYNLTNKVGCYSIPLFLEKVDLGSTITGRDYEENSNRYSFNIIKEWWEDVGKFKNLKYFNYVQ